MGSYSFLKACLRIPILCYAFLKILFRVSIFFVDAVLRIPILLLKAFLKPFSIVASLLKAGCKGFLSLCKAFFRDNDGER